MTLLDRSRLLRRLVLGAIDMALLAGAWILSYVLRPELADTGYGTIGDLYRAQAIMLLPWVVGAHLLLLWAFGLYAGMMRYVGTTELRAIGLATVCNVAFWTLFNLAVQTRETFLQLPITDITEDSSRVLRVPFGVLGLYFFSSIVLVGGFRFSRRLWAESRSRSDSDAPATLVVGAGDTADGALREIFRSEAGPFRPVGIVTPSDNRQGSSLHGVPVRGTIDDIPRLLREDDIQAVLVALDDRDPGLLRQIVRHCHDAKVEFHIVPTLRDISGGRVDLRPMRRIRIEDLLGREPVRLQLPEGRNYLAGEKVLITGAGGSIGSELARQVASAGPAQLILLGKGESSIFQMQGELSADFPTLSLHPVIADVRDRSAMERVFATHRPTIVFHAAAHKHVHLMEAQPDEAIKNNVIGTSIVAWMAHKFGAKRFVYISTDKAVRPRGVMGATKRLAEMVVFSLAPESKTIFQAVRFGNVLGSRGSAIEVFQRQIAAGGPVTVTHPDVTRFFMTIPEAVSLVLQAGVRSESGSLFLLDMGQPVKIVDLVRQLITLSGLREGADIEVKFTGLRPGEKIREDLLTDEEGARATGIDKVWVTKPQPSIPWSRMKELVMDLLDLAEAGERQDLLDHLRRLVPSYHPAELGELSDSEVLHDSFESARGAVERALDQTRRNLGLSDVKGDQADLFGDDAPPAEPTPVPESPTPVPAELAPDTVDLFEEDASGVPVAIAPGAGDEETPSPAAEDNEPSDLVRRLAATLDAEIESDPGPDSVNTSPHEDTAMTPASEQSGAARVDLTNPDTWDDRTCPVFYLVEADGAPEAVVASFLESIAPVLESTSRVYLAGASAKAPAAIASQVIAVDAGLKSMPARWNKMLADAPRAAVLVGLNPLVRPEAGFAKKLRAGYAANPKAAGIYADHIIQSGTKEERIPLHDHDGCPHERFEFGPLLSYRADRLREIKGFDESLSHAWEYDGQLRLMDRDRREAFACVHEPIYRVIQPTQEETKSGALYSPGKGALGGFSYVFYPEDMEREVTAVFERAMKRWGAWLETPTVNVPQPQGAVEVLASVVIPVLNRQKYIGNAIAKVVGGTFQDFEVVIVDNGSTDGTLDVVKDWAAKDSRIRLLHGTGGTIASALNEGIRAAHGKYICQLDSDDEYAPTTLEKMIGHLESHPKCGLCISYYRLMNEQGVPLDDVAPITHSGYSRNQIVRRDGAGAVRIFPRAVLQEFGLYDEEHYGNFGEDYDMVLKTGEKYDVDRAHEVLYFYRRHSDNTDVIRAPEMKYKNKNRARNEALRRRIAINQAAKR